MDAIGDSITKGFNAVSEGEVCPGSELENRNWSTGDTHDGDLCSDGGEGVFSQAERLECVEKTRIMRADPNAAISGARMLTEFADESRAAAAFLVGQPEPRYVTILLGHNDVCGGSIDAVQTTCPHGGDEDRLNHCRTTPRRSSASSDEGSTLSSAYLHCASALPPRFEYLFCARMPGRHCVFPAELAGISGQPQSPRTCRTSAVSVVPLRRIAPTNGSPPHTK